MLKLRKYKAFTLTELLIGIMLTMVIVGLSYSVLSLILRNMNAIEENLHISTELSLLEQQLYVDFNSLGLVIYNKTDEEILFTSPIDTVRYNVTESIIIRNLDTLNNTQNDMTFYFEGNQVQEGIIDAIKIDFLERDQNIFLYKVNDATTILLKDGTED
tara:strand:+ start:725032 stop:725508 length:477 start_codon:yes stop_codon:yes gene_type:complete